MAPRRSAELMSALTVVAPGTQLRAGLDRILQAKMGGLVVVGDGPEVLNICSGGFLLDAAFSPQRLSELAKMDGAIILASDASRIARANVHLVPNPNVPTSETGTRHRTAERVARSIDVPVISISEDMAIVAVYAGDQKHTLEPIPRLLTRANQAIQTLERYRNRLDEVTARCPRWRWPTSSPCATSSPCCSARRWCGAWPRRSRWASSSSASRAGWCGSSSRS